MKKQNALLMVNEKFVGYSEWLEELKGVIRKARLRTSIALNSHVILRYWRIGRDIFGRQKNLGLGAKVIDRLAVDLRKEFPDSRGFSCQSKACRKHLLLVCC